MKFKIYLAGPFFNPEQVSRVDRLKAHLESLGHDVFSPKDEFMFVPGETKPDDVLESNIAAMVSADICVAITDGKDVGTMWECGFCFGVWIPVIYFWETREAGQKFNLMLAATGSVAHTMAGITEALRLVNSIRPNGSHYVETPIDHKDIE